MGDGVSGGTLGDHTAGQRPPLQLKPPPSPLNSLLAESLSSWIELCPYLMMCYKIVKKKPMVATQDWSSHTVRACTDFSADGFNRGQRSSC